MLVDTHAANCFVNIVLIGIIPFSVTRIFWRGVATVWATFQNQPDVDVLDFQIEL